MAVLNGAVSLAAPVVRRLSPSRRELLILAAVGLLGLLAFHWPDVRSGFTEISGERGDSRLIGYLLEHGWQRLQGHGHWRSPAMFWPAPATLGYADAFVLHGLTYWPMRALGLDPLAALQWTAIVHDGLTFLTAALFLRKGLRLDLPWALLGAWLFAYSAPKLHQTEHMQLQSLELLPLVAWLLFDVLRAPQQPRQLAFLRLAGAALLFDLQLVSGFYAGWFLALFGLLAGLLALLLPATRARLAEVARHQLPALAGATLVLAVGLIPFALIYLPVVQAGGLRSWQEVARGLPPPVALLRLDPMNLLWGWTSHLWPLGWEAHLGFGLVVSLAFLAALAATLRKSRGELANQAIAVLTLTLALALLLAFRWPGIEPGWFAIHAVVPGAGAIRAVGRWVLVGALPLAIVLAWRADRLARDRRWRPWLLALGIAMVVEQLGDRLHFDRVADVARLQQLAARVPRDCEAFYVTVARNAPPDEPPDYALQIDAMWASVLSGVPTVNGYSGQGPKGWLLGDVRAPAYPVAVQAWASAHGLRRVCGVEVR